MPVAPHKHLLRIIAQLARQVKNEPDLRTSRAHESWAM